MTAQPSVKMRLTAPPRAPVADPESTIQPYQVSDFLQGRVDQNNSAAAELLGSRSASAWMVVMRRRSQSLSSALGIAPFFVQLHDPVYRQRIGHEFRDQFDAREKDSDVSCILWTVSAFQS